MGSYAVNIVSALDNIEDGSVPESPQTIPANDSNIILPSLNIEAMPLEDIESGHTNGEQDGEASFRAAGTGEERTAQPSLDGSVSETTTTIRPDGTTTTTVTRYWKSDVKNILILELLKSNQIR